MIEVSAGEDWDEFVAITIAKGFADLESLSGIPGTVGEHQFKILELMDMRLVKLLQE